MCVVSMIGDYYNDKFRPQPWYPQQPLQPLNPSIPMEFNLNVITREEFDALKRDVAEMKELLKRAKIYDEKNNEPDCEVDEKMEVLRKVAKMVGISLDDVIPKKSV